MKWVYIASLVGFAAGMAMLPVLFPGTGWFGPPAFFILALFLFPYVPSVYGPVVIAHSILFSLGIRSLNKNHARSLVAMGAAGLLTLASVALVAQFLPPPTSTWLLVVPGLTSAGYGVAALGWKSEANFRERGAGTMHLGNTRSS